MSKWKYEKLSTLCIRIGDGLHGTPIYTEDSGIFFINGNNLQNGRIVFTENTREITAEEFSNNFIPLNENSLLLSINGTLGSMAFYNGEKVMLGKSAAYLNFKSGINRFYYYYFQLPSVQKYFYDVATGSTIKNLSLQSIQDFEVPVPDFSEWDKIAAVLSALDAKIELNRRINAELEAMAKTLYDYWFVQFDFPDAKGKPYKTSGGKMVWNEALKREVPEGWEVGKIDNLGEIVGGSTPPKENPDYFSTSGNAWITPKDLSLNVGNKFISKGETDVSEKGLKVASLKIMPAGTVLLSSRAPIGYLAISRNNVTTNQGFKSIIPANRFSPPYVFYVLKNLVPTFEQKAVGSTFKEISAATLKSIEIDLPPRKIIQQFTEIVKPIFEKQDKLETESHHLTALRDWLLPLLMNGQVRVGSGEVYEAL